MIRKITLVLLVGAALSACASGKVETTQQSFRPAQFVVTDVTIDVETEPQPDQEFLELTRTAAENLRQAYNDEMFSSVGSYTLELSLQDLKLVDEKTSLEPITDNSMVIVATIRHPESGVPMRVYPVTYQLIREDENETRREQLLRGALPAAFNGVYGLPQTPENIQPVVTSNQIFDGLDAGPVSLSGVADVSNQTIATTAETVATSDSTTQTQAGSEPTVIGCAIC